MAASVKKLEKSTVELRVSIPDDMFEEALNTAYLHEKGKYAVQGFRKGHAPRHMIERFYGPDVFYDAAIDIVAPKLLEQSCKENDLTLAGRPTLDVDMDEEKRIVLVFVAPVYPEVKLGKYKGLEIIKREAAVDPAQVEAEVVTMRNNRARYIEVDRAIQDGDRVILDYKGRVGDTYFEGGSAEKQTLDIGSGRFIPGFEEGMIGMKAGEDGEVAVTFPEQYHAPELAGKDAVFEVHVHEVREKELPEIDDDLAKDVSEFDTLEEWKQDIHDRILARAQQTADTNMKNEVIAAAAANAELEIPDAMVESQMDSLLQDLQTRLSYQGISLNDYCQYAGTTPQALREQMREDATRRVRNQLVLDEITKVEDIKATEEEIAEHVADLAKRYNQDPDAFAKNMTEDDRKYISEDVAIEKTLKFLLDNAKLVDEKKKAPAKKTAAKKTTKKTDEEKAPAKKTVAKKTVKAEGEKAEKKPAAKKSTAKKTDAKPAAKKTTKASKKDAE